MYFDRFDICEAWFLALSHCHGGMNSREYRRLCRLQTVLHFKPSPLLESPKSLTENGRRIYDAACRKLLKTLFHGVRR
jgi:hypothetical protein